MPKELLLTAPRTAELREYHESSLEPNQIRICSELTAVKHGTELRKYRSDTRDDDAPFDWERRLHVKGNRAAPEYPIPLGNVTVGTIVSIGESVEKFKTGDCVYGYLPVRETHTVEADRVDLVPPGLSNEACVYVDPARVALHAVRDARIGLGDRVAVFGAGAIGLMVAQAARLEGARFVAVSEPIECRRNAADTLGADLTIDPTEMDVGAMIKTTTESEEPLRTGVDCAVETSGSYAGLSDAIRATAYGGIVASCSYYTGDAGNLFLEGEWHRNRLELRSVRPPSEPLRDHPRWDLDRLHTEGQKLLEEGRLSADGLLHPVHRLEEAPQAYELIDRNPAKTIKVGITYD